MYKRNENVNLIVTESLKSFHQTLPKFEWITKLFFEIHIGSDGGFNPEISFSFRGDQHDELSPQVLIDFFLHDENSQSVMIYSAFDPKTKDDIHISQDIEVSQNEITSYFDKAMRYIGGKRIADNSN